MVHICHFLLLLIVALSVLALSSRFDGPQPQQATAQKRPANFQYSLCRVVLMVCG